MMVETHVQVMHVIEAQVKRKISAKEGPRKKAKTILERSYRRVLRRMCASSDIKVQKYEGDSSFGFDESGRDVESGALAYVEILKKRGVRIHTLLILGSRAKGRWRPESDVDVTIVASNLPRQGNNFISKRLYDLWMRALISDRPLYMGIEPSGCCSRGQFMERLEGFDVNALDAVIYGQIIYDDGFWLTVKKKFLELREKYCLDDILLRKVLEPL
jgi:predicted nucleotidyltransferase